MTQKLYRRTFTKLSVLSGGALLLPTAGLVSASHSEGVELSDDERELLERFAEAFLPTEGSSLKPRAEVPMLDNIEHAFSLMDEPILEQVRIGLKLFDYGAVVIGLHFARFVSLSIDDRLDYIRRWEDGIAMQRGIVGVLKKLMCFGYWTDIEAGRSMGYPGPVSVRGGVPNLGNAPMPAEDG